MKNAKKRIIRNLENKIFYWLRDFKLILKPKIMMQEYIPICKTKMAYRKFR